MQKQDKQAKEAIALEQARKDLQKIVGLPVARAWKGTGTAISFDLGGFSKALFIAKNREAKMPDYDDWSVCVDDWKLLKDNKVIMSAADFSKKGADQTFIRETLKQFTDDYIRSASLSSDKSAITLVFGSGKALQVENPGGEVFYYIFDHKQEMITLEQAKKELQKIVGLPVVEVWSAFNDINLELGKLHPEYLKDPKDNHWHGMAEWTIRDAFDWKIKKGEDIIIDSTKFAKISSDTEPVEQAVKQFKGAKIVALELNMDASSMFITFDTGTVLQINRGKNFFFELRHNRKPFLGIDKKGRAFYDHNVESQHEMKEKISPEQAKKNLERAKWDLQKIVGLPVARVWKGFGTAIFLELGRLHLEHRRGPKGYRSVEIGDWTLGELWYWKIIHDKSVVFDTDDYNTLGTDTKPIKEAIGQLLDKTINSVKLNDDATSLTIVFDTNYMLQITKDSPISFSLSYNYKPILFFNEDRVSYHGAFPE